MFKLSVVSSSIIHIMSCERRDWKLWRTIKLFPYAWLHSMFIRINCFTKYTQINCLSWIIYFFTGTYWHVQASGMITNNGGQIPVLGLITDILFRNWSLLLKRQIRLDVGEVRYQENISKFNFVKWFRSAHEVYAHVDLRVVSFHHHYQSLFDHAGGVTCVLIIRWNDTSLYVMYYHIIMYTLWY